MLFADYFFETLPDGSIMMDKELSAKSLNVKNGDTFTVMVTFDGRIMLKKEKDENGSSRTN